MRFDLGVLVINCQECAGASDVRRPAKVGVFFFLSRPDVVLFVVRPGTREWAGASAYVLHHSNVCPAAFESVMNCEMLRLFPHGFRNLKFMCGQRLSTWSQRIRFEHHLRIHTWWSYTFMCVLCNEF